MSIAQKTVKCATPRHYHQKNDVQTLEKRKENERIIQDYIKSHQFNAKSRGILRIPVVIHIIHNGEAIGSGVNISDAQAKSQIDILNKDFRLLNDNKLPSTHPFASVAADVEIEFCLAAFDPSGNPTSGITRYKGGKNGWNADAIDNDIKPKTIWNPKKYLNLWCINMNGDDAETLGYATLPNDPETTIQNDGVVIRPQSFGKGGLAGTGGFSFTNLGRTATHEIGHYFNLEHIWGDENCGNDFVADTPPQKTDNYDCPSFPHNANNTCGAGPNGEMFMNYMDYVDDNCMKLFTLGQKARMLAAINSFRPDLVNTPVQCNVLVSANDVKNTFAVTLYPNPVHQLLTIESPSATISSIEVFSLLGNKVAVNTEINDNQSFINTSQLPNGHYFIHIKSGNKVVIQKFEKIE